MKFVFFSVLVLSSNSLFAQLPESIPSTAAELESANAIIANEFAPDIHQLVEAKYANSADGRADLLLPLNYNGWDRIGKNWDDLPWVSDDKLLPKVYYSVIWTSNAWVVTYALYHARDYSTMLSGCCGGPFWGGPGDNHEHDLEGTMFVVDRSPSNFGNIIGAFSTWHKDLFKYIDVTSVPTVFSDNQTHAIELNLSGSDDISSAGSPCDDGTGVEMAGAVVYTPTTGAPSLGPLTVNPDQNDFLIGNGEYILEDIFSSSGNSLSNKRNDPTVFVGNEIYWEESGGCEDEGSPAKAPWGWDQMDYSFSALTEMVCWSVDASFNCVTFPLSHILGQTGTQFVVEHNPYHPGKQLLVTADMIYSESDLEKWAAIIVFPNKKLTIDGHHVKMKPGASIVMMEGSQLIVKNSILSACTDNVTERWNGIKVAGNDVNIEITHNSTIKQSMNGISNKRGIFTPLEGFDLDLTIANSVFMNNDYSLRLVGGQATLGVLASNSEFLDDGRSHFLALNNGSVSLYENTYQGIHDPLIFVQSNMEDININSCDFISNDVGIIFTDVQAANVINNNFNGVGVPESVGVNTVDSRINISVNNSFEKLWQGITAFGTGPMQSGMEIGHEDAAPNTFEANAFHIDFSGSDFPTGANVINNTFGDGVFDAIAAVYEHGSHLGLIKNNTFAKNQNGVYASATGDNRNLVQCNEFQSGIIQDLAFVSDNSRTMFLENDFDSPDNYEANVQLYTEATIATQGAAANAAGNCFTETLPNSIALTADANGFDYFYYDQGDPCQIPTSIASTPPYELFKSLAFIPRCLDGVGSNISDPGGTGGDPSSQLPPIGDPSIYACTSCIQDSVNHWVNQVIATGGDDPYTSSVDPSIPTAPIGIGTNQVITAQYAELMLDQWINYALFVAIDSENYAFGEQILTPLKKWKWQVKRYGLALLEKDHTKATNILSNLLSSTPEEVAFHQVQVINLKRLAHPIRYPYRPTEQELLTIYDVATSYRVCSGYARSLYKVLTGITIPPDIKTPSPKNPIAPRSATAADSGIYVYPNPTESFLTVEGLDDEKSYQYKITDLVGKELFNGTIAKCTSHDLDVSRLGVGLYYLVLINESKASETLKFVIK